MGDRGKTVFSPIEILLALRSFVGLHKNAGLLRIKIKKPTE